MKETDNIYEQKFKSLNFLFNILSIASVVFILYFCIQTYLQSEVIYYNTVNHFFDVNGFVGRVFYQIIQFTNIINFDFIYNKFFVPTLIIELLYIAIPVFLMQSVILLFKRYVIRHNTAIISTGIVCILLLALLFSQSAIYSVLDNFFNYRYTFKNTVMTILILGQILLFLGMLFYLNKLNRFNFSQIASEKYAHQFIRVGSAFAITLIIIISVVMFQARTQVNHFKETITIEYIIDLRPAADNLITITPPERVQNIANFIGLSIPEKIQGGAIIEQFNVSTLDVGKIVNDFTHPIINQKVETPLNEIILKLNTLLFLVIAILILEYISFKYKVYQNITAHLQFLTSLVLLFGLASAFTFIMVIFVASISLGASLHLFEFYRKQPFIIQLSAKIRGRDKEPADS